MADWTGKTLGKVQINDLVARGGMAEIYTGIHETHGLVAIKVMRGILERDEHQLTRFKREAEVAGELHHPNIVRILDFAIENETPCLIMDFINGPSLASHMKALHSRQERIPTAVVGRILRAVAGALDYAHARGIVHRDIKPANILLRSRTQQVSSGLHLPPDVEPVLTDFGLVRLLDSTLHTTTGSVSGTPTYMSPEQARGEKVDHRTDIYSLGIVLYEMLAGTVPFHADSTYGMLMKHINEPPPPIEGISADLQALLDRALAKEPDFRYQSAGEMADEFMAIFNGQTASPITLHAAKLARKAVEELRTPKSIPRPVVRFRWAWIALETAAALALAYFIFQLAIPTFSNANNDPPDPDAAVGRLRFSDFSGVMDEVRLSLDTAAPPPNGYHYEAWLIGEDASAPRKLGIVVFSAAGVGQLSLIDPDQKNFLADYHQLIITRERDDIETSQPSGEVAYSSVFPFEILTPLRHLLVSHDDTPEGLALIQGLWYYSGSYINISINGYREAGEEITGLREAYEGGDEATVRRRTEEIINQIVGAESALYRDHDGDSIIANPADGFGSFPNGGSPGYLQAVSTQVELVMGSDVATSNIRANGENIQICILNMEGWLKRALELSLQLQRAPFDTAIEPVIAELESLGDALVQGSDEDQDGLIEPRQGECGANSAYEFAYNLADMPLFPGANRIPPPGK
jgi:serine/threonine protein kinase